MPARQGGVPPTMGHRRWEPRTWADYQRRLAEAQQEGNEEAYLDVKSWIAKINNILGKDRTDEQKTVLNQWTTPLWVPDTLKNTNRQLYVGGEARPQKAAPRTPKVANPTLTSPPVDWARWLYYHGNGTNSRPGIQKTGRGVNLRTVRGMMLVQQ
jgi:hypothetical protein